MDGPHEHPRCLQALPAPTVERGLHHGPWPVRGAPRARIRRRRERRQGVRAKAPRSLPSRRSAPQESLGAGRDQLDHPHPDRLDDDQAQQLKAVLARCPELEQTAQHIRAFAELMNNREGRHLGQWIDRVQADDLPALHSFVNGLGQDLDAVVAGLSLRYSSGAVEGHNNKIKMLKRQMFGRANFDLLRKRVLLAA
ncbi:transposase [Streptomyces mirabilis]|uniref:transposase n=1 Tax=Streptomyces mirabilis TaxID=68239 RepID=UPI00368F1C90